MKEYQKQGSTIYIDERVKEAPMIDPNDQKATFRAWNLLRDYTHSLYGARDPRTGKEDYR